MLKEKWVLLKVYRKLSTQIDEIMALYQSMVEYALNKYKEIVWTVDGNYSNRYKEKDWNKQYPYIIHARKHKGVRSPEGDIYLNRIWSKGSEMRVDGYGYKGRICKGWKSNDVEVMADFVCDVYPDVYDMFKQELGDVFAVYNQRILEFIDTAFNVIGNKISVNKDFYDFGLPCTLRMGVDYFIGMDAMGKSHSFIPKHVYRLGGKIFCEGETLNGGKELKGLQVRNSVDEFRIIYGMIFGKDYLHPIIGWQICMIPDGFLLGSDKILASERWMAELLCHKANGDWFVLSRKLMDNEEVSEFTFRGS